MEEDKEEDERNSIFKKFKFDDESATTFKCSEAKFSLSPPLPQINDNIVIADNNDNNTNNTNNSIVNVNNVHTSSSNRFSDQREKLLRDKSTLEHYLDPKHANFRMANRHSYNMMTSHYDIYQNVSKYVVNWEIMKVLFIGKIKDNNSVFFQMPMDILKVIIQYYRYDNKIAHKFPRVNPDPRIPNDKYNKELKATYNKILYDSDMSMRERVINRYLRQKKLYVEKPIPNEPMYYLTRILNDVNKILKLIN